MTRWKMVPVEPTDEMFMAGRRVSGDLDTWDAYLAAAPKWEPSDEDVERAIKAHRVVGVQHALISPTQRMRAALKAAFGGES